jgi:hypothetical protein
MTAYTKTSPEAKAFKMRVSGRGCQPGPPVWQLGVHSCRTRKEPQTWIRATILGDHSRWGSAGTARTKTSPEAKALDTPMSTRGVSKRDPYMTVGCAPLSDKEGTLNMDPDDNTEGSRLLGVGWDSVH